jgi:hypothetical protein
VQGARQRAVHPVDDDGDAEPGKGDRKMPLHRRQERHKGQRAAGRGEKVNRIGRKPLPETLGMLSLDWSRASTVAPDRDLGDTDGMG